jgi:hypothetical protein
MTELKCAAKLRSAPFLETWQQEPSSASTDEAAAKISSPNNVVGLPAATAADSDHVDTYPMTDTQPNSGASTRATGYWTPEEDAKLTSWTAVEDNKLKDAELMYGGKNWSAIATLVSGRSEKQCHSRWNSSLDPDIVRASGRKGSWTAVEDSKLRDAVLIHGGKNWGAIAALVPGRTGLQCRERWSKYLTKAPTLE